MKGYHSAPIPSPPPPAPPAQVARSAAEELFDASSKFRQLPCRTFISVGTCPYRERCVYLHDPRCICKDAKTKTRRKNKEDMMPDSLFWPVMPYDMVASKLDANQQPHVIQQYQVPYPQNDKYQPHDRALYSIWMNFVDSCVANSNSDPNSDSQEMQCYKAPDVSINIHTCMMRLPIFMLFSQSNGKPLSIYDIRECKPKIKLQATTTKKADDSSPLEKNKTLPFTSPSSTSPFLHPVAQGLEGKRRSPDLNFAPSFQPVVAVNQQSSVNQPVSSLHAPTGIIGSSQQQSDAFMPFSPVCSHDMEQRKASGTRSSAFNQFFLPIESADVVDNFNSKVCSPDRTTRSAFSSNASSPHSFATADFDAKSSKSTDFESFFDSSDNYLARDPMRDNECRSGMSSMRERGGSLDTLDTLPSVVYPKALRQAFSPTNVANSWQFSPQFHKQQCNLRDFPEVSNNDDDDCVELDDFGHMDGDLDDCNDPISSSNEQNSFFSLSNHKSTSSGFASTILGASLF